MHLLALGMVMKRDTQRSPALICASFAARAAAGEAANGSLHKLGMDCLYAALHVTAIRYAAEKRYLAESIAELREIEGQSRRRLISW
jgi:hypothetical protein